MCNPTQSNRLRALNLLWQSYFKGGPENTGLRKTVGFMREEVARE
jgi:hypothetical protein